MKHDFENLGSGNCPVAHPVFVGLHPTVGYLQLL